MLMDEVMAASQGIGGVSAKARTQSAQKADRMQCNTKIRHCKEEGLLGCRKGGAGGCADPKLELQ